MKVRHAITSVTVTPVDPKRSDPDKDEFIMRPKFKRKSIGENQPESNSTTTTTTNNSNANNNTTPSNATNEDGLLIDSSNSSATIKTTFTPAEINLLPRQPISSTELCCAICNYSSKVRTNIVRHLEFHTSEKVVPTTAPVNPVPCLEKNEKMFDKMTNLALSSFTNTSSRMGGRSK